MLTRPPALLLLLTMLAGCGSMANPMNWFGSDAPDEAVLDPIDNTNPLIPDQGGLFSSNDAPPPYLGSPINTVADLTVERIPGGVVIRATGRTNGVGAFNARLSPVDQDERPVEGVLSYRLEAQYTQTASGAREVTVARQLTDQQLANTRRIRVEGLENALERRR